MPLAGSLKLCFIFLVICTYCVSALSAEFDSLGRLISWEGKQEVACPVQTKDTAVILVIGQSLSANHASQGFTTKYPQTVLNYFNGKCYTAASPLLGASSQDGEFITPMGDLLIESKRYKTVIIVASGIGGTAIARWQEGGDLNEMVLKVVDRLNTIYRITDVIWQQGESDYLDLTPTAAYVTAFNSLANSLQSKRVNAPIFISVSSKCGPAWLENNSTSLAQKLLIDNKKVFLGVNSDKLLEISDRTPDECHLMGSGQIKIAKSYAEAILKKRK
jgi:hypothetical protein